MQGLRIAVWSIAQLSLSACATSHAPIAVHTVPELVTGPPVTSVALLGTLHISPPVRARADSLLEQRLRASCPSVTIVPPDATARRLAARSHVPPRELSVAFAREAREVLGTDLFIAPMALGLTYDTRNTLAGAVDAITRPLEWAFEDRAGIAIEGWDLRSAERTAWVVRMHASENSWTRIPEALLSNAVTDAVRRLAPLCAPSETASGRPPNGDRDY